MPTESSMKFIVSFLTGMFELGCSFNAINLAKSALFSIVPVDGKNNWNENPDIRRFCKEVLTFSLLHLNISKLGRLTL